MGYLEAQSLADEPSLTLGSYPSDLITRRITEDDAATLFAGVEQGLITWRPGGRFDTLDRPRPPRGRWWLIEKDGAHRRPCWEFVPQLAAYVELIIEHGYHRHRVLFDTPQSALQLDLAVLNDDGQVVVLGEAKKEARDLDRLEADLSLHQHQQPTPRRGDEPRQLAWRLWVTRAPYLWLVAPSDRRAFKVRYDPLRFTRLEHLPQGSALGLAAGPAAMMAPPVLTTTQPSASASGEAP
ncbi:hypothetical protein [Nocardioides pelophilus]|uniref:hypothetical protein n=1 Tax=Nocardioides pelophilus TaxID=2172019 RepID=UPI001601197D|nr:hypothetical protein [Nocardioides pelophilus]